MPLRVMTKTTRGCGTKKIGGLYLYFEAAYVHHCKRLPLALPEACPCCGEHIRQIRSVQAINPKRLFGDAAPEVDCGPFCSVCHPETHGGLMWVGKQFYSVDTFRDEAFTLGISKRIPFIPKGVKPGDMVFFAHPRAIEIRTNTGQAGLDGQPHIKITYEPGVFLAARLTEIQKILSPEQAKDENLIKQWEDLGVTPVLEIDESPAVPIAADVEVS